MAKASYYQATGNTKTALKEYDTLIKLEPLIPEGYYLRALIDTSLRDKDGSIRGDTLIRL